jgi:hypothetical protein
LIPQSGLGDVIEKDEELSATLCVALNGRCLPPVPRDMLRDQEEEKKAEAETEQMLDTLEEEKKQISSMID